MTNGAILSPLKLNKVITYLDKEIFMLFFYSLLFCKVVLLQATLAVAGALHMSTVYIVTLDCHDLLMCLNLSLVCFTEGV